MARASERARAPCALCPVRAACEVERQAASSDLRHSVFYFKWSAGLWPNDALQSKAACSRRAAAAKGDQAAGFSQHHGGPCCRTCCHGGGGAAQGAVIGWLACCKRAADQAKGFGVQPIRQGMHC